MAEEARMIGRMWEPGPPGDPFRRWSRSGRIASGGRGLARPFDRPAGGGQAQGRPTAGRTAVRPYRWCDRARIVE